MAIAAAQLPLRPNGTIPRGHGVRSLRQAAGGIVPGVLLCTGITAASFVLEGVEARVAAGLAGSACAGDPARHGHPHRVDTGAALGARHQFQRQDAAGGGRGAARRFRQRAHRAGGRAGVAGGDRGGGRAGNRQQLWHGAAARLAAPHGHADRLRQFDLRQLRHRRRRAGDRGRRRGRGRVHRVHRGAWRRGGADAAVDGAAAPSQRAAIRRAGRA